MSATLGEGVDVAIEALSPRQVREETDALAPARGIMNGLVLSASLWVLIVWLATHFL